MSSIRKLFLDYVAQTSDSPLLFEPVRAEGIYLLDAEGKKYIDFISGIAVSSLGHGNKAVLAAINEQAQRFMHVMVYGEFVQAPQALLAQKLCSLLPESLKSVYFVNSGNEAVDGAVKLAKRYTNRPGIISFKDSYHGSGQGALSLMGNEMFKQAFRPLIPGITNLDYNEEAGLKAIDEQTAAVVIECIQGETGATPAHRDFMMQVAERCRLMGALLIVDEIQSGMGRTGNWFAFEDYKIVPDVLCLAKSFGAGLPLGAFISSREIMSSLSVNPILGHITTFGGNAVCCAAALAGINETIRLNLIAQVNHKEAIIRERLKHPLIRIITGKGLMLAMHLDSFSQVQQLIRYCMQNGLISDWFLFCPNAFRIAPPLIITEPELNEACDIILAALNSLEA
jgi:acetylornithine/N-succinyldiaminopimelate aminotransferase